VRNVISGLVPGTRLPVDVISGLVPGTRLPVDKTRQIALLVL